MPLLLTVHHAADCTSPVCVHIYGVDELSELHVPAILHEFLALVQATCLSPLYHKVIVALCRYVNVYHVVSFHFLFELEHMYLLHI